MPEFQGRLTPERKHAAFVASGPLPLIGTATVVARSLAPVIFCHSPLLRF
jgi:hypothetical protein